jgi:hypothetical protein
MHILVSGEILWFCYECFLCRLSYTYSLHLLFIYSSYCPYATLGYERPTPHLLTDTNIHSDTQTVPRKLSSLTLYIDLWQEGKPAPGQNLPVIFPPVVIFRRIGVRAEIRTQNPVLSNTRLAKMVPHIHYNVHYIFVFYSLLDFVFSGCFGMFYCFFLRAWSHDLNF